jgi:hypothetical protein
MDQKLVARDQTRKDSLDKCEAQIADGKRRGQEAVRMIAKALNKIRDEELYLDAGKESFNQYVEQRLGMERHIAQHICEAYDTIKTLEAAGVEMIPAVESQLVLLNKIPKEDLPKVWTEGIRYLAEQGQPVNTVAIRQMVDFALKQAQAKERPGVNPEIKIEGEESKDGAHPARWTEDAEIALERIGRIAGKQTLQAIEKGIISISDRDLIKWAEQSDQMLKNIAYYIVGERWSLRKALQYEESAFNELTTLIDLTLFATARGGEYRSEFALRNTNWEFYIKKI